MRRVRVPLASLFGGFVILLAPAASRADRIWTLQLKGGSVVLAMDRPEERGNSLVFHLHPDALFASVRTGDVVRITSAEGPPKKKPVSIEGKVLVLGRDMDPPELVAQAPMPSEAPPPYADQTLYSDYGYGYGSAPPRGHPGHQRRMPPATHGSNGYPILQPGGAGTPLPVGPNGFPILAPSPAPPPVARPFGF